ncbi:ribosome assembly RNA-binding protein YhbY [Candidatus Formimonas warabiya]|uniref:RNA-binding protein n=1 Tax=Formimonas warabiya TaxID=1761012 RepID=A0A3G1KSP3_FORW1|nr:ribosome assembly RNA-binding protein YhbY [Candidatus Formimonas warabiya]ATW25471.1 RNA-binding protein [Candidatus Formimonas warabiya]
MLTGKQRRFLRAMGTGIDPIFQIGKGGMNENLLKQLDDALEARELIKVKVLANSEELPKEVAGEIADATGSELVQVIGKNMLFFRQSKKKPRLELP